jgi:hypothetical protein
MLKALPCLALIFLPMPALAQPVIHSVGPLPAELGRYEKLEIPLGLTASYANPYDYEQVRVWALLTGPDGSSREVEGFYLEDYALSSDGSLTPAGQGFRLRFAPHLTGPWTCQVSVRDASGSASAPPQSFTCVESALPHNQGFARLGSSAFLRTDAGSPLVLIGENLCWQSSNVVQDYSEWLGKLRASGGNYFRLWHAHWGLGIEWKSGVGDYQGLRRYEQRKARYQDWLHDYCAEQGLSLMLTLQHHGQVSSQVNPNWDESPYNVANGGPCAQPSEFFTHSLARAHTRNRLRYIVARWGYSRALLAWELFNEVDWTDNYPQHQAAVRDWHSEMAAYLKSIDPYQHLVTTSFADEQLDPQVWANPDIDFTQTHHYISTPNLERVLAGAVRRYLGDYGKPSLSGEFGISLLGSDLAQLDPGGIHFHNCLWGGLFGGGMGSGMSWWWDIYIDARNLYPHIGGLAAVVAQLPLLEADMRPAPALVSGAPGDLLLTPRLGWGGLGSDTISIGPGGIVSPEDYALGTFLYGAQWNTQFRRPPLFEVNYPAPGPFTLRTGSSSGASPRIVIRLDGAVALDQPAAPSSSYSISIPPGPHRIQVDNAGTDWISIASYRFAGLGSALDAYVLRGADAKSAAGWLLSNQYTHEALAGGLPAPVMGAQLRLSGLADTAYFLKWYDCLTGAQLSSEPVAALGGELILSLPPIAWDRAFLLDPSPGAVAGSEAQQALGFALYPNPARAGGPVQLRLPKHIPPAELSLLDAQGRLLAEWPVQQGDAHISLPAGLSPGLYWVRLAAGGQVGAQPLLLVADR